MGELSEAEKYKEYMDKIKGYRDLADELEPLNIPETARIRKMVDLASKTLAGQNYARLETIIPNIEDLAKIAKQKKAVAKLQSALGVLKDTLQKFEDGGVDVKDLKKVMDKANTDFEKKKYSEAKKGAMTIRSGLKEIPDSDMKRSIMKALEGSKDDEEEKKEHKAAGGPTQDGGESKKAPEPKDNAASAKGSEPQPSTASKPSEEKDQAAPAKPPESTGPQPAAQESVAEMIKVTWSRIKDAKAKAIDVEAAIKFLDEGRDALQKKDEDAARRHIIEANRLLELALNQTQIAALRDRLGEIRKTLVRMKEVAIQSQQVVKTKDIEDYLDKAETLIDIGDVKSSKDALDKADWSAQQLLNILTKKEEGKALGVLKDVKAYITRLKEQGVDIEPAKAVFKEAEPALAEGNLASAVAKAQEALEVAKRLEREHHGATANKMVDVINNQISELKSMRVDLEKTEPMIKDFQDAYSKEDFTGVLAKGEDLKNQLYFLKMERLKVQAEEKISVISNLLMEIRNQGAKDMDKAERTFSTAQDAFNLKQYEKCLAQSDEVLKELHTTLKNILGAKLSDLKSHVDFIMGLDLRQEDKEKLKEQFGAAARFFESDELMKAKVEIQSGKNKAHEILKSRCTEKMISLQMIVSDIHAFKGGKDPGLAKPEEAFKDFGKRFKSGDFMTALETAEVVEGMIDNYLQTLVLDNIRDTEAQIPKLTEWEIDVGALNASLQESKTSFAGKKNADAFKAVARTRDLLSIAIKDKATGLVVSVQEDLTKLKEKGFDTAKIDPKFKDLAKVFGKKDYVGVITLAKDIRKAVSDEEKYHRVVDDLMDTKNKIMEADSMGCDISEAAKSLQAARPLLESGNYDEALAISKKCREFTQSIIERTKGIKEELKAKTEAKITDIDRRIREMKATGIDIAQAEALYDETRKAFGSGDFGHAFKTSTDCIDELERESRSYNELVEAITKAKSKITEGKKGGLNVSKAEELLKQMVPAFEAKDYKNMKELSRLIQEEIVKQEEELKRQKYAKEDKKKILLEEVGKAQFAIESLKKQGINPKKANELFQKVIPFMQEGKMEDAIKYALQSKDAAESLLKLYEDFKGRLKGVEEILAQARAEGINVGDAERIYGSIQEVIGEGDFIKARDLSDKCAKELRLIKEEAANAQKQIAEVEEQLADALSYGLNPPSATKLLEGAKEAYSKGDYKRAVQLTNDCAMDIMSVIPE